ncbi:hypothetical protein LB505_012253 [Fusarium chuoi]|nr:hypothetical protein LB505_012253 [Fusarium chuoi]
MADRIFRIFNPGGQFKSYRGRKDKYARTLEEELAKSRSREAELARECEQLRAGLQNALQQLSLGPNSTDTGFREINYQINDYATPSRTTGSSSGASPMYLGDPGYQSVDIVPSPQLISPSSFGDFSDPSEGHGAPVLFSQGYSSHSRVGEVDQVIAGMEFVLKYVPPTLIIHSLLTHTRIEEPCLGHLHGDAKKPDEPGNHALTATAQLMAACGDTSHTNNPRLPSSPSFGNTPSSMLERLLTLAPDLSNEDEMTPIQAWNDIRCRPNFGGFSTSSLGSLAAKLMKAAKCHG